MPCSSCSRAGAAGRQDNPPGQPAPPDTSQARPYAIDSSNIQLARQGEGSFTFDERLLTVAGKSVSVAVTTRGAWGLSRVQRAHTAMKAAHDIQRATGAETVLLYLLLDAGLPKISYSVATVAYAPGGRDWNDGHGVEVWDVEMVKLLLSKGADPNLKSKDGFTVLAAIEGPDDPQTRAIRRMLKKAGAR